MKLRSLVPSRDTDTLMNPDFGLFGFHREIDRLFDEFAQGLGPNGSQSIVPNIEVSETDEAIEITAEMPGLERKDVEISVDGDTLTIRGEKRVEEDQNGQQGEQGRQAQQREQGQQAQQREQGQQVQKRNVQHSERRYGVFLRVLQLPPGIDPSSIQATMSKGVLKVTIPKPAKSEPKRIEVKEAA
jgi:HSP20 family protein